MFLKIIYILVMDEVGVNLYIYLVFFDFKICCFVCFFKEFLFIELR